MSRYKRNFWYAQIITAVCWIIAGFSIPITVESIISIEFSIASKNLIIWILIIGINVISVVNMSVIGFLKNHYA